MIKIFDCSNSIEKPKNRGLGCPIENDIIRYLKENCHKYNSIFIDNYKKADIILTNDVFPEFLYKINIPKIKRMDGIYWQNHLCYRNEKLNKSALLADHVIFISEYSKNALYSLYNIIPNSYSICLNQSDPNIYKHNYTIKEYEFCAISSSWDREEKRLKNVLELVNYLNVKLLLIGNINKAIKLPNNIKSIGYINNPKDINRSLNLCRFFLNLSYRDACPKVVNAALFSGLPVLYADSGGIKEMVSNYGTPIKDNNDIYFEDNVPDLSIDNMINGYNKFFNDCNNITNKLFTYNTEYLFNNMLDHYFYWIKKISNI